MKNLLLSLLRHPLATLINHKEFRYLVSGGVNALVEYSSFLLLMALSGMLLFSNSLSFILGMLCGFILHKTWSFKGAHHFRTRYQFAGYVGLAVINFFMANVIISYLVRDLDTPPAIAKLISIAIVVTWTFFITNYIIFKHRATDDIKR